VTSVSDGVAEVRIGTVQMRLPARGRQAGPARLAARPNRIDIRVGGAENTLAGKLRKVTYVGSHLEFVAETQFGDVFVTSPDVNAPFEPGAEIGIGFPAKGPVLITD
jgi:iron(III) transport system ATP-binding protein